MNKKILIIALLVIIVCAGLYLYIFPNNKSIEPKFICGHPNYELIQNEQNKERIIDIIGNPDQEKIKSEVNTYNFGQGDMENKIKEGWIYNYDGWEGHIEIYFNENGIVIGKNCGNG